MSYDVMMPRGLSYWWHHDSRDCGAISPLWLTQWLHSNGHSSAMMCVMCVRCWSLLWDTLSWLLHIGEHAYKSVWQCQPFGCKQFNNVFACWLCWRYMATPHATTELGRIFFSRSTFSTLGQALGRPGRKSTFSTYIIGFAQSNRGNPQGMVVSEMIGRWQRKYCNLL